MDRGSGAAAARKAQRRGANDHGSKTVEPWGTKGNRANKKKADARSKQQGTTTYDLDYGSHPPAKAKPAPKKARKTSTAKKSRGATMKDAMPATNNRAKGDYGSPNDGKRRGLLSRLGAAFRNADAEKGRRDFGIDHD